MGNSEIMTHKNEIAKLTVSTKNIVAQLRKEANTPYNGDEEIGDNYVNPLVAQLMKLAQEEIVLPDGSILSKNKVEDLNRNNNITGPRAKYLLSLVFDRSAFYNNFTVMFGDEKTIPIDMYSDMSEQLMSTVRMGRQLDSNEELDLFHIIGQELKVDHVERQYDIPMDILRNFLYRPDFESIMVNTINTALANDFLRLATNGYTNTYGAIGPSGTPGAINSALVKEHFYTLKKGHEKHLKELKGAEWVNSNGDTIYTGKLGQMLTPNKLNIDEMRELKVFDVAGESGNEALFAGDDITVTHEEGGLKADSAATNSYAKYTSLINVKPYTAYRVSFTVKCDDDGGSAKVAIENSVGSVVAMSPSYTTSGDFETHVIDFYSGTSLYVNIRLYSVTNAKFVVYKDLKIERKDKSFDGNDIIDIMDKILIDHRDDYKMDDNAFVMAISDYEKYASAKSKPVMKYEGQVVSVNTDTRERYMASGEIPLHKGHRIIVNPYKIPIDQLCPDGEYGNIYYGKIEELLIGAQERVEINRSYTDRWRKGGSAILYTHHYYIDFGIRNREAFTIAFRGENAKCEVITFSTSNTGKGTKKTGCEANDVVYPYCDTPGVEIFVSDDTNNLDDYKTAVAKKDAEEDNTYIVARDTKLDTDNDKTVYLRAFKDGLLLPSDKVTFVISA